MTSVESCLFIYNQLIFLFIQYEVIYPELKNNNEMRKIIDTKVKWMKLQIYCSKLLTTNTTSIHGLLVLH